ncbi:unnamed protein product [Penicillium glandicola]
MLNQHRLPRHPMSVMEERYMPLQVEDPHATAYSQTASPFTTRIDLTSTLSSNGSTYCESDLESLEHFDEPFTTRTAETHAGLIHPTPRSNMFTVASNSFLLGTEETPSLSSFGIPDVTHDQQDFSNTPFDIPDTSITNNPMGTPLNPHSHNVHLLPSIASADSKPVTYDEDIPWAVCPSVNKTDIWYSSRDPNGSSEDSGWHHHNGYSAPWPVTNAYTCQNENNEPVGHAYEMNNGLPMPSFAPTPLTLGPSTPMTHLPYLPYLPSGVSHLPSIEAPQYHPTPQQMYLPNVQPMSSYAEFASLEQKPAHILSPSFSASTNEEEQSPQQSGEDQAGVEASLHYSDERNAFLIDCKRRGLSYKDIKRVGGFKEAESTLRGRYRTLTKSKDQRVRKPKWQDKDIRLLCEAVSIHAETYNAYSSLTNISMSTNEPPKVSWKRVAEHIRENGGSYHFGNATCKKKWCEIHNITI